MDRAVPALRTGQPVLHLHVGGSVHSRLRAARAFAHFGGGLDYAIAATVAGLGCGWAFMRTQRIETAMAVHFGVNAVHFLLFTYPRLV